LPIESFPLINKNVFLFFTPTFPTDSGSGLFIDAFSEGEKNMSPFWGLIVVYAFSYNHDVSPGLKMVDCDKRIYLMINESLQWEDSLSELMPLF
jgi:hypothetical protein